MSKSITHILSGKNTQILLNPGVLLSKYFAKEKLNKTNNKSKFIKLTFKTKGKCNSLLSIYTIKNPIKTLHRSCEWSVRFWSWAIQIFPI